MNKSHKRTNLDIAQNFLNAMKTIHTEDITVDFHINIRQYQEYMPMEITIFDEDFNNFCIYLYQYTDINPIAEDLASKNYSYLKVKYRHR